MLNQVQTNLSANSNDGGPLTGTVVFTAFSGFSFLSVQRFLGTRSRAKASRDDEVSGFPGWLYGMTVFSYFQSSWHGSGQDLGL